MTSCADSSGHAQHERSAPQSGSSKHWILPACRTRSCNWRPDSDSNRPGRLLLRSRRDVSQLTRRTALPMTPTAEIDALFKRSLDEFTAARNSLAARLKKEGRAVEAERVKAIQKPPATAW